MARRFVSIDFLRGIAIIMMLVVHQISDLLDINTLLDEINDIPLLNVLALVVLPFIGGLAGFFLLVSSIGNSVSMTKYMMKGNSASSLGFRQFVGGFILYIFAMLSESTIGYWGGIMGATRHLDQPLAIDMHKILTGWGNFETIHTIAWCIMINGIIHAILSRKDGWKNPIKQMKIYGVLAILVVVATPFIWIGVSRLIPGFPWGTWPNGELMSKPNLLTNSIGQILAGGFFGGMAAEVEPIFPYLAVSFIGTMIGIAITQPEKGLFKHFFRFWFIVGMAMLIVGIIGVAITIIGVMNTSGFDKAVEIYRLISFHRDWAPDKFAELNWVSYLWQFLSENGFAVVATITVIYIIEYRGKGAKAAEHTKFVRRFGFVAFTCYNSQFIYPIVNFVIPQYFGYPMSPTPILGPWWLVFVQIGVTFLVYHIILSIWEKANYRGSIEWIIAFLASYLVPGKRGKEKTYKSWKSRGDLAVDGAFYHVDWVSLVDVDATYHMQMRDSKVAFRASILSFLVPVFLPFTYGTLFMSLSAQKLEGTNKYNKTALILSCIGIVIMTSIFVLLGILTPNLVGFQL